MFNFIQNIKLCFMFLLQHNNVSILYQSSLYHRNLINALFAQLSLTPTYKNKTLKYLAEANTPVNLQQSIKNAKKS